MDVSLAVYHRGSQAHFPPELPGEQKCVQNADHQAPCRRGGNSALIWALCALTLTLTLTLTLINPNPNPCWSLLRLPGWERQDKPQRDGLSAVNLLLEN